MVALASVVHGNTVMDVFHCAVFDLLDATVLLLVGGHEEVV